MTLKMSKVDEEYVDDLINKIKNKKRGKLGSKEFKDLRIDKEDKALINFIKKKVIDRLT